MKVRDIIAALDELFHFSTQDSWDNSGLIIGDPNMEAKGALCAVDITESVVDEAIEMGYNVIVAHHPILFRPLKRLNNADAEQRLIVKAIKHDISLIAVHTPLDKTPEKGTSATVGAKIGLKEMRTMIPEQQPYNEWGYGVVGKLDQKMSSKEFLKHVAKVVDCQAISHNGIEIDNIQTVCICTGSSIEFASKAEKLGADVYITSDIKYHQMASSEKMLLMDIGHFESEKVSTEIFLHELQEKFPNFALRISNDSENIIKYYINTDGK
ncbi:MAG: Nif3-like dinuclear metal center hexameric protein [Bacteroidia bacterium]|nr:Nif3-like dinuclear metal center hexameric protein [Bacteroidia bacterium]